MGRHVVESSGTLIVKNVRLGDEGVYSCRAENLLGGVNASAKLTVQCKLTCYFFLHSKVAVVCYTAVFSVVTQRSSPQTAAENRTTFLSLCGEERCVTTLKTAV